MVAKAWAFAVQPEGGKDKGGIGDLATGDKAHELFEIDQVTSDVFGLVLDAEDTSCSIGQVGEGDVGINVFADSPGRGVVAGHFQHRVQGQASLFQRLTARGLGRGFARINAPRDRLKLPHLRIATRQRPGAELFDHENPVAVRS